MSTCSRRKILAPAEQAFVALDFDSLPEGQTLLGGAHNFCSQGCSSCAVQADRKVCPLSPVREWAFTNREKACSARLDFFESTCLSPGPCLKSTSNARSRRHSGLEFTSRDSIAIQAVIAIRQWLDCVEARSSLDACTSNDC